jgi:hypothetical protein
VVGGRNAEQVREALAVQELPPLSPATHDMLQERYRAGEQLLNP